MYNERYAFASKVHPAKAPQHDGVHALRAGGQLRHHQGQGGQAHEHRTGTDRPLRHAG